MINLRLFTSVLIVFFISWILTSCEKESNSRPSVFFSINGQAFGDTVNIDRDGNFFYAEITVNDPDNNFDKLKISIDEDLVYTLNDTASMFSLIKHFNPTDLDLGLHELKVEVWDKRNYYAGKTSTFFVYEDIKVPVAKYEILHGNRLMGRYYLDTKLFDKSEGVVDWWRWEFGDGSEIVDYQGPVQKEFWNYGENIDVLLTVGNQTGQHTCRKEDFIISVPNGFVEHEFVSIQGGNFTMGNNYGPSDSDYSPAIEVGVNRFKMSKYETQNWQFAEFLNNIGYNPEEKFHGISLKYFPHQAAIYYEGNQYHVVEGKENHPVVNVTWYGAQAYSLHVGGRLPTEKEWEFAARGGNLSENYAYSGSNDKDEVGWFDPADFQPVGTKEPNELGLYDMSGNASEIVFDYYQEDIYEQKANGNNYPGFGPDLSQGYGKAHRGGSVLDDSVRVYERGYFVGLYNAASRKHGFRVVKKY